MEAVKNITNEIARAENPSDSQCTHFYTSAKLCFNIDTIYVTIYSPWWEELKWEPRYITGFFPRSCDTSEFKLTLYQN